MYRNKKVGLIIPTRYGSERLNGKVLCDIAGKIQIERIIERALKSKYIDKIILAITDKQNENRNILDWFFENEYKFNNNLYYHLGWHDNLIKRCFDAANFYGVDIIVDISHDCSFFDPNLADVLIERLFDYEADYSANCITRTFPDGFDIQVYTKEIYQKIFDTKHWWRYTGWNIWQYREEIFPKPKIINLEAEKEYYYPDWHLCLDSEQDKIVIEKIYYDICDDFADYKKIINYLKLYPEILEINKSVIPTKLNEEIIK